ncbi:hypothetical protein TNCV_2658891 [Trichonephila clavipes]|nr:hypothetical protein TNCV_2658891 [Trichonephila clavipes]
MDDLRVVYVKVKGEQEMVNAVIDTGAQMPVVRPDVVEGQSIDNRGSIQITSAFGEHEMGTREDMWSWSRIRGQQRLCTVMSPNPSATKDSLYKGIAARKYAYPQFFTLVVWKLETL